MWRRIGILTGLVLALTMGQGLNGPPAEAGIAASYPSDAGIENDPDVLFAENFEADLGTVLGKFNGFVPGTIVQSIDKPGTSGGAKSALLHPGGGGLYRLLTGEHDQVYFRYYIKYAGADYHHSGGFIGGYFPRSAWPMGDAGLKGIRPDGSRLVTVGFETQGTGAEPETDTRLDTYMNWIDMQGQEIAGGWWGRNMLRDLNIPIRPGVWQCVEIMIKMNSSPTAHDGELAIWIDGVQRAMFAPGAPVGRYDAISGNWIMDPAGAPFPGFLWRDVMTYGVNWIKVLNYDDAGLPTDIWVDDLVVATKYIGPINSSSDTTPPAAPTNLRIVP